MRSYPPPKTLSLLLSLSRCPSRSLRSARWSQWCRLSGSARLKSTCTGPRTQRTSTSRSSRLLARSLRSRTHSRSLAIHYTPAHSLTHSLSLAHTCTGPRTLNGNLPFLQDPQPPVDPLPHQEGWFYYYLFWHSLATSTSFWTFSHTFFSPGPPLHERTRTVQCVLLRVHADRVPIGACTRTPCARFTSLDLIHVS